MACNGPNSAGVEGSERPRLRSEENSPRKRIRAHVDSIEQRREDDQEPIAYWSQHHQWPHKFFEASDSMATILARKRSATSRSRTNSDAGSVTASSTTPTDQKPREKKSAEYRDPRYRTLLATKSSFMEESELGITDTTKREYLRLLDAEAEVPSHSLFRDDLFKRTCRKIQDRNEARVVQDITRLIVPSAETLATYGATNLQCLIESVNEGWNNCIPITKTRPQPDYAVGFRREAFTQAQLDRMQPVVGDLMDQSYFMATYYMYFPFLTCEVKCGSAALDIADRQNAHSMTIAVRAVVELFRAVKREKEIHRGTLAFSISHDNETIRIYGHYAEVDEREPKYYRHTIRKFDFTELDGREKWTAYKFIKNIYDIWMPVHFQRICSAIDAIPSGMSFAMSESDLHFTEQSGLSEAQDMQSSVVDNPSSTSSTSLNGGAFKKPRRDRDRGQK